MKKNKLKKKKKKNYIIDFFNESLKNNLILIAISLKNKKDNEIEWLNKTIQSIDDIDDYSELNLINIKNHLKEILYLASITKAEKLEDLIELKARIKELTKKFKEINKSSYIKMQLDLSTIYNLIKFDMDNPELFLAISIAKDILALICSQDLIIENKKIKTISDIGNSNYIIEYVNNEIEFKEEEVKKAIKDIKEDGTVGLNLAISNKYTLLNDKFLENKYVQELLENYNSMNSYAAVIDINDILTKYNENLEEDLSINRRYVYPQEGVMITFKRHKNIKSIEIYEDKYFYVLKYNIEKNDMHKVNNMKINYENGDITGFTLDIDKNQIVTDDALIWKFKKENLKEIQYYDSNIFSIDENNKEGLSQFHKLGILVLYVALCDHKYLSNITIGRINNGYNSNKKRSDGYRIAHRRRLGARMIASKSAKEVAKEAGIILPIGYTFVQEHNESSAKQKIIGVNCNSEVDAWI